MLLTSKYSSATASSSLLLEVAVPAVQPQWNDPPNITSAWSEPQIKLPPAAEIQSRLQPRPDEIDPLYLFSCHLAWEKEQEPSAAWELLAAVQSSNPDTRAHARALLASSRHFGALSPGAAACRAAKQRRLCAMETDMAPYGLDIIEDCRDCQLTTQGFFCGLSSSGQQALNEISHKSILPAGAILFVEGQSPRGMFILCSGKVNLSTTSREGKILILKTADNGQALGLSASISGSGYESTAETATPVPA